MQHNTTILNARHIIRSLKPNTLLYLKPHKDTKPTYAILLSLPTPTKYDHISNHIVSDTDSKFTLFHKCYVIFNNSKHEASLSYEKYHPKRFHIRIKIAKYNTPQYPITQFIPP